MRVAKFAILIVLLSVTTVSAQATVDSVSLNGLQDTYNKGHDVEISAEGRGENLEEIRIQRSESGFVWETISEGICIGSPCDTGATDTADASGEVLYRAKLVSKSDAATDQQSTEISDSAGDGDGNVATDGLEVDVEVSSREASTDESILVTGEASGDKVEELRLQSSDDGFVWESFEEVECLPTTECDTSKSFSKDSSGEVEIRARALGEASAENSETITLSFLEEGTSQGYSISNADVRQTISPEGTATFSAEVDAPESESVTIDWFLGSDIVTDASNSGSGVVTSTISYSELRDKGFSPGSYELGSRVAAGGDQKDTDPGGTVEIEPRQETDFGDDNEDNGAAVGDVTLIVDLEDAEGDDMDGGDYTLEGDGQIRQKDGGSIDTRFTSVDASESYDLSVQCGPETVRKDVNPSGVDTQRVELILDEASTIDSCVFYSGSDPDPSPDPEPEPSPDPNPVNPSADIQVIPETGEEGDKFTFDASGSSQADRFEFDFDGDGITDRITDGDPVVTETINNLGQNIRAEVEVFNDGESEIDADFYTVEESQEPPQAELEVTPRTGQEGDTFTFDASSSERGQTFMYDFDGDGVTEETTSSDVVTRQVDDIGQNIRAEVTVLNDAGESTNDDLYTVEQEASAPQAKFSVSDSTPIAGQQVDFDASSSTDPDGDIVNYEYSFGDGSSSSGSQTTHSYATSGTYTVQLMVEDSGGRTDTSTKDLNVQASPSPSAKLSADKNNIEVGESVSLDASGSIDSDGSIVQYDFDPDGDGDFERTSAEPVIENQYSSFGSFDATVRVTDDQGKEDTAMTTIEVNAPPKAEIGADNPNIETGDTIQLDASNSMDPDGSIAQYDFDPDGDGDFEETDTGPTLQNTYSSSGTFSATIRVTDGDGATDTASIDITATTTNSGPSASISAGENTIQVGDTVTLDASSSSDPDGNIAQYDFDPDGDGDFEETDTGPKLDNNYGSTGSFEATVRVTDNQGKTSTAATTISVGTPPKAQISADSTSIATGQTVKFDASGSSDPDGSVQTTKFDLNGDGTFEAEGPTAQRQFSSAGTFEIAVRATDDSGLTDTASVDVSVGSAPSAAFSFSPQSPQRGSDINFQSTATDPDNNIESKNWRVETPSGNEFNFNSGDTAVYTPQNTGTYLFTHSVTDSDGLSDTTTKQLQISEDDTQQCGVDDGSISGLELDPEEVEEDEESDVSVEVDNDGADQDVEVEFVSFDFSTGDSKTIDTVEREVEEDEEEGFETEVEVDADSRITAEVFTEGDECGDRFITSTSERLEFSGQQEEDGVVRVSTFTNLGTGVNAFVTLTGPEDRAVNVGGDGEQSLTVEPGNYEATARFSGSVRSRSINVESGEVRPISFNFPSETTIQTETATGLTARLDSKEVDAGQRVRVRGDIRGISGPQTVQLYSEGDRVSSTSSARDGSYTVSFTPNRIGELSLSVRTADESAERSIQVLPTSSVLSVDSPQQVFEGDQFQVCGRVQTQEQAEVSLLRNGEDLESRSGRGEVCFDTTAQDTGKNKYTVRSSTYGNGNQKSTTVEVLEDQAEASISTDQVATVETESGTVRVSIYNDNNEEQTYKANIVGIPDTWAETTTQEVVLQPGEEEDIYFYTTPREEGDFNPRVQVTEGDRTILNEGISLEVSGQKTQEQVSGGGLVEFILGGLNPV